jgi:hypothetical protein
MIIHNDEVFYLEEDDETPFCEYCYTKQKNGEAIHNYSYKPEPIFHGNAGIKRYFGVELEIDKGGTSNDNAYQIIQSVNETAQNIYIKKDGSLSDGFEIVTHPMTLEYHMDDMKWAELSEKALEMGYKSHKTETCGLHIHVNRTTFSDEYNTQENCISRVLFILERFWEELIRFSRRSQEKVKQWANRYGFQHEPSDILYSAKRNNNSNRYTCLNLNNDNTIEFRIFRGTLKRNTIISTLQLVNYICDMAISMSTDEIKELNWCEFVERINKTRYFELITYLKERRLYVNEPVESEEDN